MCAKIMERIIHKAILSRAANLIDRKQHSFLLKKSCSCTANLISLV